MLGGRSALVKNCCCIEVATALWEEYTMKICVTLGPLILSLAPLDVMRSAASSGVIPRSHYSC